MPSPVCVRATLTVGMAATNTAAAEKITSLVKENIVREILDGRKRLGEGNRLDEKKRIDKRKRVDKRKGGRLEGAGEDGILEEILEQFKQSATVKTQVGKHTAAPCFLGWGG